MNRRVAAVAGTLALALCAAPSLAQEEGQEAARPSIVRMSYYQVSYADLERWNAAFAEHAAPVLRAMQEEGSIQGFSAWQHDTGGRDYNWRLAMRFFEGANVDQTVTDFVERLGEAAPEAMTGIQRMIRKHEDQIWRVGDQWFREDGEPSDQARYYVADFQLNPADFEAWNAFYGEVWKPALISAAEAGHLGGFVTLEHAHGGPYNWQIILFAPNWDSLDDVWNTAFEAFGANEARFAEIAGMIQAHDDAIWIGASLP